MNKSDAAWLIVTALMVMPGLSRGTVIPCDSCSDCNTKIAASSPGDITQLNQSIPYEGYGCILLSAMDNITFDCDGYTITGPGDFGGINVVSTTNSNITNCVVEAFGNGIFLNGGVNNTVINSTFRYDGAGVNIYGETQSRIIDSNISYNFYALYFEGGTTGNYFDRLDIGNNYYVVWAGTNNYFTNSNFHDNFYYAAVINEGGNYYFNNIFNNTNNFETWTTNVDFWNTTNTTGPNIVGGPYIGGNYYAYPNGTGYSETCSDSNNDGFCDSPYYINDYNVDNLTLSNYTPPSPPPAVNPNYGVLNPISYQSEYLFNETGKIVLQFLKRDSNGTITPINDGNCTTNIFYPNESLFIGPGVMSHIITSNGLYSMSFTVPEVSGIFVSDSNCTQIGISETNAVYSGGNFKVNPTDNPIKNVASPFVLGFAAISFILAYISMNLDSKRHGSLQIMFAVLSFFFMWGTMSAVSLVLETSAITQMNPLMENGLLVLLWGGIFFVGYLFVFTIWNLVGTIRIRKNQKAAEPFKGGRF